MVQCKRKLNKERQEAIDQEVEKLLHVNFIREVIYTTCLSNVIMVKNANGKWRMCINYTDLNRACSKDTYTLPNIDRLVDKLRDMLSSFSLIPIQGTMKFECTLLMKTKQHL